jgi:hypothetical protein
MLQKLLNVVDEWGKLWGVSYKGIKCLVMGELKQIRILSLKSLIVASLSLQYKEIL